MFLSFHVEEELIRSQFLEMMASDAEFLADVNIMDYSLLLGVTFHQEQSTAVRQQSRGPNHDTKSSVVVGLDGKPLGMANSTMWNHRLHCWASIEVRIMCHGQTSLTVASSNRDFGRTLSR